MGPRNPVLIRPAQAIHGCHFYGAAGVAALGWATSVLAGFDGSAYLPLWFAGMLTSYNVDRLRQDPADAVNVPLRHARQEAMRAGCVLVTGCSAGFLFLYPLVRGEIWLLGLVAVAAVVSLAYSVPLARRRVKDVPLLKTFYPPAVVTAAFLIPPLIKGQLSHGLLAVASAGWVFCILLANMILCDLRDLPGDVATGVKSLPVLAGTANSRRAVLALGISSGILAWIAGELAPHHRAAWLFLAVAIPSVVGALEYLARRSRSEAFYEWWVEGLFLLPAAAVAVQLFVAK